MSILSHNPDKNGRVQVILRMPAETYESIRVAARKSNRSFNRYAVETLETAANPKPVKKYRLEDLKLNPVFEDFLVPGYTVDFTEEEIEADYKLQRIFRKRHKL